MTLSDHLPPFARELAELIGEEAMITVCDTWGGLEVFIPRTLSVDSAIPLQVGMRIAVQLAAAYGGSRIYPPKLTALDVARRHTAIRSAVAAGVSHSCVAEQFGLTMRHVRRITSA